MKLKEILPINFIFHRAELKIADLPTMFPVVKQLFREAVNLDLHITGPVHWHYEGFAGDYEKSFHLDVLIPVATIPADYDGLFHFKRTGTVRVLTARHEGDWQQLPKVYTAMAGYLREHHLTPSGIARELYINTDFADPRANSTEVQMVLN